MTKKDKASGNCMAGKPVNKPEVHTSSPVLWKDKTFVDKLITATKGLISGDAVIYKPTKKKKE